MSAIPTSRNGAAFQKSYTTAWLRDNALLQFGNDGDASIKWNTSTSVLDIAGAVAFAGALTSAGDVTFSGGDVKLSDTVHLEFGAQSTIYMTASEDASGASDSIKFIALPSSDTAVSGALYIGADGSDLCVTP